VKIVEVHAGGRVVAITPLRGLKRLKAFEDAMREEKSKLEERESADPLAAGVFGAYDMGKLLKLGAPDVITDELLNNCTADEMVELLTAISKVAVRVDQLEPRP
jgi:hypothetical protein